MISHFNVDIGFSELRHIMQAFSEKHILFLVPDSSRELQAGHSVQTGRNAYGRSAQDFPGSSRVSLLEYRMMSLQWQHLLGLSQEISMDYSKTEIQQQNSLKNSHQKTTALVCHDDRLTLVQKTDYNSLPSSDNQIGKRQ